MAKKRESINKIGLIILSGLFFCFLQGKSSLFAINSGNTWVFQENLEPDAASNCTIHPGFDCISSEEISLIAGKNGAKAEKYPIASMRRKYRELNFELSVARTNLWFFPLGAAGSMGVGYLMIQLEPVNWWRSIIWVYGWAGIASSVVAVGMTFYNIYRFFSVKGKLKRFRSNYRESLSKAYPGFPESVMRFESLGRGTKLLGNSHYIKIPLVKINFG